MIPRETDLAHEAQTIWQAGVDAVLPSALVPRAVRVEEGMLRFEGAGPLRKFKLPLAGVRRIVVVGAGEAGAGMAEALEEALGDETLAAKDVRGVVAVPDATVRPLQRIELIPARASHDNAPTEASAAASRRVLELIGTLGKEDLLLVLVSGGASALLPAPAEGVTLGEKQRLVRLLQARGADIAEVNCVRKHLSLLKGGGLVASTRAGLVVGLAISDVMGDGMDVIGSGPTAPDATTHSDALRVLARYGIDEGDPEVPAACLRHLRAGAEGAVPETMKTLPARVKNLVIGGIGDAMRVATRSAEVLGWRVMASRKPVGGDTKELAQTIAWFVEGAKWRPAEGRTRGVCMLTGGETTVKLGANPGLGGRNQELVLGVAAERGLAGMDGAVVLSGGTDGEDGPTDAAGAWLDAKVAARAAALRLDPKDFLARHDSYRFFEQAGGLLRTGFTGTNVMDLRVALVLAASGPPDAKTA